MTFHKKHHASPVRIVVWIAIMFFIGICIGSLLTSRICKCQKSSLPELTKEGRDLFRSTTKRDDNCQCNQNETEIASDPGNSVETSATKTSLPMVALIIDDLGYASPDLVARLCSQSVNFDVAVLPYQKFTIQSAEIAHSKGKEVMLHLPMEPNGYPGPGKNPGPSAIMYDLPEREVRHRVKKAMAAVPFVKGVNNHMGSCITRDRSRMAWILEEVKAKEYFFVDSLTEKNSVAFHVATKLDVPSARREIFLDDDRDPVAIVKQWERTIALARSSGHAIAIGHICPQTIGVLETLIPKSVSKVQFVKVSNIIKEY